MTYTTTMQYTEKIKLGHKPRASAAANEHSVMEKHADTSAE